VIPMSSSGPDDLLGRIKELADRNFPKIKDKLPSNEQVFVLKTTAGFSAVIKLSSQAIVVESGDHPNPVSTMTMSPADLEQLMNGQLDGVQAFLSGRIKVQGDVFRTMALNNLLKGAQ